MDKNKLIKTAVIFAAFSVAGICMVVLGQASMVEDLRNTLPLLGSALFASGLTFFLVKMTHTSGA